MIKIVGQGLAGTCLAWQLWFTGHRDFFLVDSPEHKASSLVAAGIMNPIAGKGWNLGWRIDEFLPVAIQFYEKVGSVLGEPFYRQLEIERRFSTEKDFLKVSRKQESLRPYLLSLSRDRADVAGGRLFVEEFLQKSREFFAAHLNPGQEGAVEKTVWATGAAGLITSDLPHRCAKGEIISVSAASSLDHMIVQDGLWVLPDGESRYRVGATYEWDELESGPTQTVADRLLSFARRLLKTDDVTLTRHRAGIRPILRQSQPVIGPWRSSGEFIFNGLGSKGATYAPEAARILAQALLEGTEIPQDLAFQNWLSSRKP